MKSNFFSGLKDKFMSAADISDEDEGFSDIESDEYDEQEEYDEANTSGTNYDFGYSSNPSANYSSFDRAAESKTSGATFENKYSQKQNSNIYQMNNTKSASKVSRVVYFYLEDSEDACNIADCMMAQDAVVLVDMNKLEKDDSLCVLHFLDGVRYIYKSKMETIAHNVYLIVPQSIELAGDFYEQVSPGAFY